MNSVFSNSVDMHADTGQDSTDFFLINEETSSPMDILGLNYYDYEKEVGTELDRISGARFKHSRQLRDSKGGHKQHSQDCHQHPVSADRGPGKEWIALRKEWRK